LLPHSADDWLCTTTDKMAMTSQKSLRFASALASCFSLLGFLPAHAGYSVTKEIQATLTVNGPSGSATAATAQGFVFSATNMTFSEPISTGSQINNFSATASTASGTESKMSLSVSTPDLTPATGSAGANSIVLPGFSTQTYTAGGDGKGMQFNITPSGVIQPPDQINAGSSFTSRRSSSLSVF
jgi:hypothetical protein